MTDAFDYVQQQDLPTCERCQKSKPTVFVHTGFAGESELLCGDCVFEERCQIEEKLEKLETFVQVSVGSVARPAGPHEVSAHRPDSEPSADPLKEKSNKVPAMTDTLRDRLGALVREWPHDVYLDGPTFKQEEKHSPDCRRCALESALTADSVTWQGSERIARVEAFKEASRHKYSHGRHGTSCACGLKFEGNADKEWPAHIKALAALAAQPAPAVMGEGDALFKLSRQVAANYTKHAGSDDLCELDAEECLADFLYRALATRTAAAESREEPL